MGNNVKYYLNKKLKKAKRILIFSRNKKFSEYLFSKLENLEEHYRLSLIFHKPENSKIIKNVIIECLWDIRCYKKNLQI